ncbi:hypothetical protein [Elizabethkingia meningoseptica]|uniref:hypothetical protein n=1 Tax=Elizabethkingia meningoseptica TaxID=238 RepID=UPI0023B11D12|nr:hypothetical protein [Elizabethkingia meningoseptica]MDE5432984.1 hypothetical protein [Elizabethkingia meningoseptica]
MKRLEEIQNEYAIKCGFENWETLVVQTSLRTGSSIGKITQIENYHKEIAKLYAREVAQASLNKAAENALIDGSEFSRCGCEIDEQSIVNPDNIVLL